MHSRIDDRTMTMSKKKNIDSMFTMKGKIWQWKRGLNVPTLFTSHSGAKPFNLAAAFLARNPNESEFNFAHD